MIGVAFVVIALVIGSVRWLMRYARTGRWRQQTGRTIGFTALIGFVLVNLLVAWVGLNVTSAMVIAGWREPFVPSTTTTRPFPPPLPDFEPPTMPSITMPPTVTFPRLTTPSTLAPISIPSLASTTTTAGDSS